MLVAGTIAHRQSVLATRTVRHFARALGCALLAVVFGCLLYAGECFVLRPEHRFVENPAAVMMRACGLAHFWIGWLFLFTSPKLRSRSALARLLGLTLCGVLLCTTAACTATTSHPVVFLLFYGFFLVHEVRDQTMLFQAYGDAPAGSPQERALLEQLGWAVSLFLMLVLTCGYTFHGVMSGKIALATPLTRWGFWGSVTLLAGGSFWLSAGCLRRGCRLHGDWSRLATAYLPLFAVYSVIFGVLLAGAIFGAVVFNLIILIHVAAWLVFVHAQLGRRPASPSRNLWTWLRGTPTGFLTLHFGVIALILVLMAMRVYVWRRVGLLSELLATSSFPYWSLMHITMSFWRPR